MKKTLQDMKVTYDESIPIKCDNTSVISISKNHVLHSIIENIPIKFHFIIEHVVDQIVKMEYISTKKNS